MSNPAWGTAPIRCGRRKCNWKGMETELKSIPAQIIAGVTGTKSVCPECENESYMFMTEKEIAVWMRNKVG